MSHAIEPHLGFEQPHFIYDFPSSQAALARLSTQQPIVVPADSNSISAALNSDGFS